MASRIQFPDSPALNGAYPKGNPSQEISLLQEILKELDLPQSVFIYTTSHTEILKTAPIKLIFVCDDSTKETTAKKIHSLCFPGVERRIQYEVTTADTLCSIGPNKKFFPSHFIHRLFLIANPERLNQLLFQFVDVIQKTPGVQRKKFRKQCVLNHLRQLKNVIKGTDINHIDLKNGAIHYGVPNRQATKYSLLFPIQYVLDLRIIDAIRVLGHWPKDYVSFLKFMPKAIPDLIEYMYNERLLPELNKQDIADLKNAYNLGLFYMQTTRPFKEEGSVKLLSADTEELQKAYANTSRILGKINSGKFCKNRNNLLAQKIT